ncbi:MAG: FAD-dependent oxidoreductase [Sphingomonas bacterium]
MIGRRTILRDGLAGAVGLAALRPDRLLAQGSAFAPPAALTPIIARPDRIFRVTVCLRPFRAAGPRIEMEQFGAKHVVHHYGHGGSGISLSWGSAAEAVPLALATGARQIAVIGAGAIGMTTAITAQRMGAKVTVYTKARYPDIRSARATGNWSPHSRVAMEGATNAAFREKWERMARRSFAIYQSFLGLPGNPVEWVDRYSLSDTPFEKRPHTPITMPNGGTDYFVDYEELVKDLTPRQQAVPAGMHPFRTPFVRQTTTLMFNVADYFHQLESDFQLAGGRFVPLDLHGPEDFSKIREKTIINCTGFGARDLLADQSVIPVRGQIAWLLPQAGVNYGVQYNHVSVLARRDGIVVQPGGLDESFGFNDPSESPDYAAAHEAIDAAALMFAPKAGAAG